MQASDRLGGHIVQGHVDGVGDGRSRSRRTASPAASASASPPELLRYAVDKGSITLSGVSLTVADLGEDLGRGFADPRDPGADEPWRAAAGRQAERRVRHRGEVRGAVAGTIRWKGASVSQMTETENKDRRRDRGGGEPVLDDRGSDRGDPPRPHGRRLRRRGPRERGRPGDGGAVRHARGGQLHGQGGARADLPGADRRALRTARPEPDGGQERGAAADRLHGHDRGRRRGQHRDLRPRPRPHDPGRDRPQLRPARHRRPRPHVPAAGQRGRRARAHRPHRGQRRPRPPRRPHPGRRDLRGDERRRHDGPRPRPGPLLRASTA